MEPSSSQRQRRGPAEARGGLQAPLLTQDTVCLTRAGPEDEGGAASLNGS